MSSSDYHPALSSLSWLFGVWESVEAKVSYPTMETLKFDEIVEFHPTQQPLLDYKSETWHSVKKTKMHCEKGFIRIDPGNKKVALLATHNFGAVEVSEGFIDNQSLCIESTNISRMSFTKFVTKKVSTQIRAFLRCGVLVAGVRYVIVRKWVLEGEELHSTVCLETINQPLQKHLECRYKRKE